MYVVVYALAQNKKKMVIVIVIYIMYMEKLPRKIEKKKEQKEN